MGYNSKHIEAFIEKVNKEAEAKAQEVFDHYQKQLDEMVLNQLRTGDHLIISMGSATFNNRPWYFASNFAKVLSGVQYTEQRAGFSTKDYIK